MGAVLLDGIVLGLQFGILGVGLTLVYGLGGVVNLAHGQMAVMAAIIAARLIDNGAPTLLAAAVGILGAGLLGIIVDRTIMQPVYREKSDHRVLLGLLLMLGVGFIIDGILEWRYPIEALNLRVGGDPVTVFGLKVRRGSIVASAITIGVGLTLVGFFRYTTFGRATRSVIQDEEGARLCGINPATVRTVIFGVSGVLAGIVAMTQSMTTPVVSTAGVGLTIFALIVAVVGGLGSVSGAFLAGILLGIVNTMSAFYIGTFVSSIILVAAAAITILLRPQGLLGRA
ncbi:MAG: branched-chain amino acid ABC transporter permease [Acidimicrobiales bacterium]